MAKAADIGSKRLISLAPDLWVQWVTQSPDNIIRKVVPDAFCNGIEGVVVHPVKITLTNWFPYFSVKLGTIKKFYEKDYSKDYSKDSC